MHSTHEVPAEKRIKRKEYELELLRRGWSCHGIARWKISPYGDSHGGFCYRCSGYDAPDTVYQDMRNQAKLMMKELGSFAGGCNIQFSVNPETEEATQ